MQHASLMLSHLCEHQKICVFKFIFLLLVPVDNEYPLVSEHPQLSVLAPVVVRLQFQSHMSLLKDLPATAK